MVAPSLKPILRGSIAIVPLTQGVFAVIDAGDVEKVARYTWSAQRAGKTFYAATNVRKEDGGTTLLGLHRLILDAPSGTEVDHIDGNGLDNRRENLRLASRTENNRNRGMQRNNLLGLKGVRRNGKSFQAQVRHLGKTYFLGTYRTPELAWIAASIARECFNGAFANHGPDPFLKDALRRFKIA